MKFNRVIVEKGKPRIAAEKQSIWKQQRPQRTTPPITPPKQVANPLNSSREISLKKKASVNSQANPPEALDRSDRTKVSNLQRLGTVTNASQFRAD